MKQISPAKQKRARNLILKLLKKSKKQFYNEEGKEITVEEYLELLLKQKTADLLAFKKKMERKKKK